MGEKKEDIGAHMGTTLFDAIQFAWENDIWPSSRNLATIMGYKIQKLNGRMNKERIRILRDHFYL